MLKKILAMAAAVAVSASALSVMDFGSNDAQASTAKFGTVGQDVMSPSKYIAKGTYATTNPQKAPVSALSSQTAALVNNLPDRYLNDFWKGRLKTSTNRDNYTIPIYTVDSSKADANWVTVKMRDYALYKDIHPVMEGKATATATGGTYGFQIQPFATNAKNYGKVVIPKHAVPGGPIPGGDQAMTVVDVATGIVRGYYVAEKQANGSWLMGGGYITTLDNPTATNWFDKNYWLKTERGTSSVGGVMNEFLMAGAEEIAAGSINHVTSWTFPSTKANDAMWPAYQSDGKLSEAAAPKMGQRFWIPNDAATNAAIAKLNLTSFEKVVVKNLQEYGGIVTDQNYWTMALNLQHPVQYTSQGKPNPYNPGGIVHNKHGNVDLINNMPWNLTKWGDIKSTTVLEQQKSGATTPVVTPKPSATATPKPVVTPKPTVAPPKPSVAPKPTTTVKPSVAPKPTAIVKPTVTPKPVVNYGVGSRIEGSDKYVNAINVSKKYNTVGKPLILSNGDGSVDSLIAAPAASKTNASLLLVPKNSLPANITAEIKRLKPSQIIIIGDISTTVQNAAKKLAPKYEYIRGVNSSETSVLVANKWFVGAGGMFMANVNKSYDVVNASSRASLTKAPLLLTQASNTTASIDKYIASKSAVAKKTIKVVGTERDVSAALFNKLKKTTNAVRIDGGGNVYATNTKVIQDYLNTKVTPKGFIIGSSNSSLYGDTLVSVQASAKSGYPLVLAEKNCISKGNRTILAKYTSAQNVIIGKTTTLVSGVHTKTCAY